MPRRWLSLRLRDKRGMVLLRHEHSWARWLPDQVLRMQLLGWVLPLLHIHEGGMRRAVDSVRMLAQLRSPADAPSLAVVIGAFVVLVSAGQIHQNLIWLLGLCALSISMAAATCAGP